MCRKEGNLGRASALLEQALCVALLPDNAVRLPEVYQGLSALSADLGAAAGPWAVLFGLAITPAASRTLLMWFARAPAEAGDCDETREFVPRV